MAKIIGTFIENNAIASIHMSASAKQAVLESKTVALNSAVLGFTFNSGSFTRIVTTEVEAAASDLTRVTDLNTIGIYIGVASSIIDPRKVHIRLTGTDNGVIGTNNDEIFGKLEESGLDILLHLYNSDGSNHSPVSNLNIDFYFVEVFDEYSKPNTSSLLFGRIGGVIDATQASAVSLLQSSVTALENDKAPLLYARVVSQANVSLVIVPSVIGGITLVNNDLVLLTAQTLAKENGLYLFTTGPNTLTRSTKLDSATEFKKGLGVSILEGTPGIWILLNTITTLEIDSIYFVSTSSEESNQLNLLEKTSDRKRVKVTSATQVLPNGETRIQELSQLTLKFLGAEIDFNTGNVYEVDGITPSTITFIPPVVAVGQYRWYSITVVPKVVDSYNQMEGQILVIPGTADGSTPALAPRAPYSIGKPLGQVVVQGAISGVEDIYQVDIQRLTVGSGGGGSVDPIRETPTGLINGVNTTFVLSVAPVSAAHVLVFLDGTLISNSAWALQNDDEIDFNTPPQLAQTVDVFFFPDPLAVVGGGGGGATDLTNIDVNIQPDVDGTRSIGTTTKRWKEAFLKDKTTGQTWRLEVDNGVLQAVLIP